MGFRRDNRAPWSFATPLETKETRKQAPATVAAVVVLYYPEASLLQRLMESAVQQVDKIFFVDNTPDGSGNGPLRFDSYSATVFYHRNGCNRGIATAQNTGIAQAIQEGYTHVLLLDQDSCLPRGAVVGLLDAERTLLHAGVSVAAVGPVYVDEKDGSRSRGVRPGWLRVRWFEIPDEETNPVKNDYIIASGSLIRTDVFAKVGLMFDELFIDWVDAEWAYRASKFGYSTYMVPKIVMFHSIGDATGCLLGQRFNLHTAARNYYIIRNAAYLLKKSYMSWHWRLAMLPYIPKYILVHSWLSRNRLKSLAQMLRGVWEGLAGTMRPFAAQ